MCIRQFSCCGWVNNLLHQLKLSQFYTFLSPKAGVLDAMMDVNYRAPRAAASACQQLQFSHWVQSSTQATNAERGGQVPYSRAKAMIDYALKGFADEHLAVTVACLGLLYSKADGNIGQESGVGEGKLNLIDLTLLPLTPIMVHLFLPLASFLC